MTLVLAMIFFFFFGFDNKNKNKQVDQHETKRNSKGSHQQNEKAPMDWDRIFANHIFSKGLIFQNTQGTHTTQ